MLYMSRKQVNIEPDRTAQRKLQLYYNLDLVFQTS